MTSAPSAAPAVRAVALLALALHLARLAASHGPGMWLWSVNAAAFLPPVSAWSLWLAGLVALLAFAFWPARESSAALAEPSDAFPRRLALVACLATAALAWRFEDRTWFLGDFLVRTGASAHGEYMKLFPQSMPGDVWLHSALPRTLGIWAGGSIAIGQRIGGALDGALLALAAVFVAHVFGARGRLATAVTALLIAQGTLLMCTGFGKGTTEVAIATLVLPALLLRDATRTRTSLAAELVLVAAVWMHRSALFLLPVWLAGLALPGTRRRPLRMLVVVLGVLPLVGHLSSALRAIDLPHHLFAGGAASAGNVFANMFAPVHMLDVANAALVLAPALLFLPLLAPALFGTPTREHRILGTLAITWTLALLVIAPRQGVFRDLDVFAPFGSAASLLAAWALARTDARRAGLVAVSAACALLPGMLVQHVPTLGVARAVAFATQPPERSPAVRAQIWDFVGDRATVVGDSTDAYRAAREALELAPTRRRVMAAVIAAAQAGDRTWQRDQSAAILRRTPDDVFGLLAFAGASAALDDSSSAASALVRLRSSVQSVPSRRETLARLLRGFPELWPARKQFPF